MSGIYGSKQTETKGVAGGQGSFINSHEFLAPCTITSVMIYHRGASLSEQHTDLLCTKQDLSHTSRYVDESSLEIARYHIRMPTARTATLSVTTYA